MLRKTLSLVLSLVLTITSFSFVSSSKKHFVTEDGISVTETADGLSATIETEDTLVKCTYQKSSEEYNLYLDNNEYNLNVDIIEDKAFVYLDEENSIDLSNNVVGQSALAATAGLWAPAVVSAAKAVISYCIVAVASVATYYSAELIATTIGNVRSRKITRSDAKTQTKAATRAIDIVKTARKTNTSYYYVAYLYNGMVMVGSPISFSAAKSRLKRGYDVFASNFAAAKLVSDAASTTGRAKYERAHVGSGDYFPHFHPIGRKWIKNPKSMPHCWFGV